MLEPMSSSRIRYLACVFLSAAIVPPAAGQWEDETGANVLVSGPEGQAAITHSVAAPDGSTWIAWYDASSGYDIKIQRLNADGHPIFPTPITVADQSLSWVQDFDLACDTSGNAAVAWADGQMAGAVMIGTLGQTLYDHTFQGGGYYANAQICGDGDGLTVVGFAVEEVSHFHRLRPDGTFAWAEAVVVGSSGFTIVSDLKPTDDGGVLASFVHYLSFSGAKRLKAQRISALGMLPWGDEPRDVFVSGSLQYGNYPEFIADDQGGGIFTWYSTSPLTSRIQWVDANGQQLLGSSGITVTSESSMVHVAPSACLDESTGDATVFWVRQNTSQSTAGIQVNRITRTGQRLWGSVGRQIAAPMTSSSIIDLHADSMGPLACAAWLESSVAGEARVLAAAVDAQGEMAWDSDPTLLARGDVEFIPRSDLSAAIHSDQMVVAWTDDRLGGSRVFAQNIWEDGSLGEGGSCDADLSGDDAVGTTDLLQVLDMWGPCDGCPEDLTGDGTVGVNDLLVILAAWGPC
jgi:hypothetical protein